ncbi:TPA: GNAT family N-acetyltransferase [Candidatus Woesearchaeota archaeon]|nr:GNAT family N-acetyltransferase [Candidatus Woesearchaeota archaeon]HIH31630.1 GNAT family N-acetyltransferase [Candidatus Woesearchaeota archaeon]HIJ02440.1 GNAT family N-acetyltransferase [Candidatus Woesearchaeota archaeon]HIJ14057.1 GNAT family N-acetyltransferase [Candidatus Woesearchaeota archaeon]
MDNLNIRLIKKSDLKTLARIYTKVYTYSDVGEKWIDTTSYNLLVYWYKRQPDLCLVAESSGKPIGAFVAGIKPWHDGNHLVDGEIFVDPDYQKKGIGRLLSIEMYKRALKKYNAICFDATTFKDKKFPLSWYKSQGFAEVKNWTIITGDLRKVLKGLRRN